MRTVEAEGSGYRIGNITVIGAADDVPAAIDCVASALGSASRDVVVLHAGDPTSTVGPVWEGPSVGCSDRVLQR